MRWIVITRDNDISRRVFMVDDAGIAHDEVDLGPNSTEFDPPMHAGRRQPL
jgi:hypothetical protein